MTRGRRSDWDRAVDALPGSEAARARLRALLEVLAGRCTAAAAGRALGLSERRLYQLRGRMLRAALGALEPRAGGRPGRPAGDADGPMHDLEAAVRDLQTDLHA